MAPITCRRNARRVPGRIGDVENRGDRSVGDFHLHRRRRNDRRRSDRLPAFVAGLIGYSITPCLRSIGWLGPNDPFRKIGFILALGTILGAAIVDLTVIGYQAMQRLRQQQERTVESAQDWKRVNTVRLLLWVACWGVALVLVARNVLHQPSARLH